MSSAGSLICTAFTWQESMESTLIRLFLIPYAVERLSSLAAIPLSFGGAGSLGWN